MQARVSQQRLGVLEDRRRGGFVLLMGGKSWTPHSKLPGLEPEANPSYWVDFTQSQAGSRSMIHTHPTWQA